MEDILIKALSKPGGLVAMCVCVCVQVDAGVLEIVSGVLGWNIKSTPTNDKEANGPVWPQSDFLLE